MGLPLNFSLSGLILQARNIAGLHQESCYVGKVRNSDVMACLFCRSNECGGMSLKSLPGRRECCASRVAGKECADQLVFERVNARAFRRLAYVKPLCGADEASTRDDRQKGPCRLCVHATLISIKSILSDDTFRL
jgi:hypothetical protein